MISDMADGDESVQDAEWAWVAGVYRGLPATRPEEVEHIAAGVAMAAAKSREQRRAARWLFGIAAAVVLVLVGRWFLAAERRPVALASSPKRPAVPATRENSTTTKGPGAAVPLDSALHRAAPAVPSRDMVSRVPAVPTESAPLPGSASTIVPPRVDAGPEAGVALSRRDTAPMPADQQPAGATPAEIPGLTDADRVRLRAALGAEGLQSLTALVLRTTEDGLPGAPLLDRALAGVAHGAPPSSILTAVKRRVAALQQARDALGVDIVSDALTTGADALETGAGAAELAQVQRRFPRSRVTAGLLALTGLVANGVPAPDAAKALARGVDAGASDATLLAWRAGVAADVARGMPPLAALRVQLERLGDAAPEPGTRSQDPQADPVAPRSPIDPVRSP